MLAAAGPPSASDHAPVPDRFLSCDGARLRYRDEGHGPAVVLLHGWTLDLDMWDPQVEAWRDGLRLVRFDRRGFGLSSGIPAPARDVLDLEALLRHLHIGRVGLIGMSQGARTAVEFAIARPDPVACVVLDGPPNMEVDGDAEDDVPLAQLRALARAHGIDAFRTEWARHPLVQLRSGAPDNCRLLRRMLGRYPGHDLLEGLERAKPAGHPAIDTLRAPTLVVTGEQDLPTRARVADALANRVPNARRATVAGAGHLPNLDNPVAYNSLVRAFLDRHLTTPKQPGEHS